MPKFAQIQSASTRAALISATQKIEALKARRRWSPRGSRYGWHGPRSILRDFPISQAARQALGIKEQNLGDWLEAGNLTPTSARRKIATGWRQGLPDVGQVKVQAPVTHPLWDEIRDLGEVLYQVGETGRLKKRFTGNALAYCPLCHRHTDPRNLSGFCSAHNPTHEITSYRSATRAIAAVLASNKKIRPQTIWGSLRRKTRAQMGPSAARLKVLAQQHATSSPNWRQYANALIHYCYEMPRLAPYIKLLDPKLNEDYENWLDRVLGAEFLDDSSASDALTELPDQLLGSIARFDQYILLGELAAPLSRPGPRPGTGRNKEMRRKVRKLKGDGLSGAAIGRALGLSRQRISAILNTP